MKTEKNNLDERLSRLYAAPVPESFETGWRADVRREESMQTMNQNRWKPMWRRIVPALCALVLGVLLWFCYRLQPWGFAVGIIPLMLGLWKFRKVLEYNSLTVKRFRNSYQNDLDAKKFNRYVEKTF